MSHRVIHISDAQAAGELKSLLDQLGAGEELIIEQNDHPIAVLRRLVRPEEPQSDGRERARLEFVWLAENREAFAGRWVALDGNRLLASGESAQQVYAAIAGYQGIPLVTFVEPGQEPPFAGW